jgi:hypothetical protein
MTSLHWIDDYWQIKIKLKMNHIQGGIWMLGMFVQTFCVHFCKVSLWCFAVTVTGKFAFAFIVANLFILSHLFYS